MRPMRKVIEVVQIHQGAVPNPIRTPKFTSEAEAVIWIMDHQEQWDGWLGDVTLQVRTIFTNRDPRDDEG